jgi:D-glycero-D-manno-heptose 1,7-bisphosphate phosphatase
MTQSNQAVFCDRDGVIVRDVGYLSDPSKIEVLEGVPEAINLLTAQRFLIVVITNQSGVARGFFPERAVHDVHRNINLLLSEHGASIDSFYHCPHHIDGAIAAYRVACACRKPMPGLLLRAAQELGINLARSFMVGDKVSDIAAGKSAGARSVIINSRTDTLDDQCEPDWVARDFLDAAQWILAQEREEIVEEEDL